MNSRYQGIWVFAEQRGGELHSVSLELVGKARELADPAAQPVVALLLGHQISGLAQTILDHGADTVLVAENPHLASYRLLPYTTVLCTLIGKHMPEIFLMGATAMGIELAPRVAARMRTGLSAHCIDLRIDENGHLLQVVPGWGGGVIATIACPERRPQMATVMPGTMKALPPSQGKGETIPVEVKLPELLGPEVVEEKLERPKELPIEKAEVVVAGGWGIGSKENWRWIEELADVLNGSVGATRPPLDEGWAKEGQMIGQSGKTIRPKLYIGVAISGVMHHIVGMDQSGHIITINSDPKAEIFETSDVIVVEDYKKILPPLIKEIRSRVKH
jgi:electron transfer flavoprotein alpha subunit